jgi:hypothetical protein
LQLLDGQSSADTDVDGVEVDASGGQGLAFDSTARTLPNSPLANNRSAQCPIRQHRRAGYAVGSIQIPGRGNPIILHRDAVSAGEYALMGTVISADMATRVAVTV